MKKYILLVLLLIAYFSGRAQLTFDASKLNDRIVNGETEGYTAAITKQWKLYKQLQTFTTDSVFVELINHPSYIVR